VRRGELNIWKPEDSFIKRAFNREEGVGGSLKVGGESGTLDLRIFPLEFFQLRLNVLENADLTFKQCKLLI